MVMAVPKETLEQIYKEIEEEMGCQSEQKAPTAANSSEAEVGRVYRCTSTVPLEEADRLSSSGPCQFWDKSLEAGAIFCVDGLWDSGKVHIAVLEGHPPDAPGRVNMEDFFVSFDDLARCVTVPASECISLLGRLIQENKRSTVVYDAVRALGHIGGPETLAALMEAVQNREGYVRLHAVVGLAKVGDGSVIPTLEQLLTDETRSEWTGERRSVAECAREAIDRISAREALTKRFAQKPNYQAGIA